MMSSTFGRRFPLRLQPAIPKETEAKNPRRLHRDACLDLFKTLITTNLQEKYPHPITKCRVKWESPQFAGPD